MKKEELIVHCTYEGKEEIVDRVLKESFRLFLQRELGVFAIECGGRV